MWKIYIYIYIMMLHIIFVYRKNINKSNTTWSHVIVQFPPYNLPKRFPQKHTHTNPPYSSVPLVRHSGVILVAQFLKPGTLGKVTMMGLMADWAPKPMDRSMGPIFFTYIWLIFTVNVGKYVDIPYLDPMGKNKYVYIFRNSIKTNIAPEKMLEGGDYFPFLGALCLFSGSMFNVGFREGSSYSMYLYEK